MGMRLQVSRENSAARQIGCCQQRATYYDLINAIIGGGEELLWYEGAVLAVVETPSAA